MKKLSLLTIALTFFVIPFTYTNGCTGLKLTTKDGNAIHGRTLEFGVKIDVSVVFIPRGHSFTASTPLGNGLTYTSKYATIGAIGFGTPLILDGMNEKGLSVGTFFFPDFAEYPITTKDNQNSSLSPFDFPNWIVTQFASLDEIKEQLPKVSIAQTIDKAWGDASFPLHYIVYDKAGKSIVIEPIGGKLIVYDNPIGTLTNSPTFDWHLTNLRNFINLTPENAEPLKTKGIVLKPLGQGSGLVGLPGDFTPPSRFVRASLYALTSEEAANVEEGVFKAFHILNQFDIPVGAIRDIMKGGILQTDYTQITTVHDPINLKYYFRTYEDQNLKFVELSAFDKNAHEISLASGSARQPFTNISQELKPKSK